MTVRLLCDWEDSRDGRRYKVGNLLTTDAGTENGLVAAKLADTNLDGGTQYVPPAVEKQIRPVMAEIDPVTGGIGFNGTIVDMDETPDETNTEDYPVGTLFISPAE